MDDAIPAFPEVDPMLGALYAVLGLYVGVSLTIPLWVPILQKLTGQCGVFWVNLPPAPGRVAPARWPYGLHSVG
jgi:hypothetical protein